MSTFTVRTPEIGVSALVMVRSQCSQEISGTFKTVVAISDSSSGLDNGDGAEHARGVVARHVAAVLQRARLIEGVNESGGSTSGHSNGVGLIHHRRRRGHFGFVRLLLSRCSDEEL